MKFRENSINDFFNSKAFTLLTALALIVSAYLNDTIWRDNLSPIEVHGIFFTSLAESIHGTVTSTTLNVVCILLIGLMMVFLNKSFNFIRSATWIFASVFFLLMASSPITSSTFSSGTILCFTACIVTFPLFGSFQNRRAQRSVFSAFALVTLLTMFQYSALYLLVALALGFMLMRIMTLRSILATIIGIITPFWIVLGFGLAGIHDFTLPSYQSLWAILQHTQMQISFINVVTMATLTIIVTCANLFKIINYKLQVRTYNGFFVYLTALTILMLAIDYPHAFIYISVLYLCFSVQFAHFFTINEHTRRYIAVILLIAIMVALRLLHYFL